MKTRWTLNNTCIHNIGYHLIWCTKYRKKILVGEIELRLKALLVQKAVSLNIIIESLEVMPDHIHLFVKASPIHSPHYIVQQLKGFSSRLLSVEYDLSKKTPSLWTRSYYCESVGHISESTIKRYIDDQKSID